jgi:hypothetical protein
MFKLVRHGVSEISTIPNQQSWPIRIEAYSSIDMEAAKIFVYQTAAAPVADHDFFSCVAGAAQMTELPEDSGDPGVPFYRTNTFTANCRSAAHAEAFWRKIQGAVQDLADSLSLIDSLSVLEEVTILPNA